MSRTVCVRALINFCFITVFAIPGTLVFSQPIDMAAVRATEEFRWGLTAYHRTLFSEAVLAFERSLALKPDDLRTTEWLGRTYYRLGYEDTALSFWQRVVDAKAADATLLYLIDTIKYKRGVARELAAPDRFVETYTLAGNQPEFILFARPASIFPRSNGGYYVTSFADNRVLRFNANSAVDRRFLGGVSGLDHPFDVVETEAGYLFITEFLGNSVYRSDLVGQHAIRFGEKGTGDGSLLGPQYLAADGEGYLYVTESGNRRVSKFDYDGNFILSFGGKVGDFPGFMSPTGIVVDRGLVYVCDQRRRSIFVFDPSGNFVNTLVDQKLVAPEGLSLFVEGKLLLADTVGLKIIDIENETISPLTDSGETYEKVTKAVIDMNGNILATDFTQNTISILTGITSLYTGLLVEVDRIDATKFPHIVVEAQVQTRDGVPVVGLDESNFVLTERSGTVKDPLMLSPEPGLQARMSVILEESARVNGKLDIITSSIGSLYDSMSTSGGIAVYRAGEIPVLVGDSEEAKTELLRRTVAFSSESSNWRLDSAVKLGTEKLTAFPGSRAVVLVTSGDLGSTPFEEYPPDILAAFMRNNGIAFYCVYLTPEPPGREVLEYLCSETGGASYYIYRPSGIGEIADRVIGAPTGRYFFQYDSDSLTEFGKAYIPVEAEVLFYRRTGRGRSAYFPPLEY